MRDLITICCLIFATWTTAQQGYKKVIEYPIIEATNTRIPVISKVELTDTATILHFKASFRPNYWIKISKKSSIQVDSTHYTVLGSEGIELDKEFWMPETGKTEYTLFFPPIPKHAKSVNYIGDYCTRCWKIYGIDLTGKSEYPLYPQKLPLEYQKAPKDGSLPDFQFKVGKTRLKVHIIGYRKEMKLKLRFHQSTLCAPSVDLEPDIAEDGTATFEFDQYGSGVSFLAIDRRTCGQLWIAPGEQLDVYINLQAMAQRDYLQYLPELKIRPALFAKGYYENLNKFINSSDKNNEHYMNLWSGYFADYRMTAEQYIDHTIAQYDSTLNTINSDKKLPRILKEYMSNTLLQSLFCAVATAPNILRHNYKAVFNKWGSNDTIDYNPPIFESIHFDRIRKHVEFNSTSLLMGEQLGSIKYEFNMPDKWLTNTKKGLLLEIKPAIELLNRTQERDLKADEINLMKSYSTPFFYQIAETMMKNNRKTLNELSNTTEPIDVSNVKAEEVLNLITSRHKGKVILIDVWNTWCGPCRYAIKQTEPLKNGELKSDDLVWVYLANETSPKVTYLTEIAKIEGEHYRLSKKQYDYICDKFGIKTIPAYILVNKDGEMKLRTDFKNHGVMINSLKEMIR